MLQLNSRVQCGNLFIADNGRVCQLWGREGKKGALVVTSRGSVASHTQATLISRANDAKVLTLPPLIVPPSFPL